MMTFNQFKKLSPEQQETAIWHNGEPIAARMDSFHRYELSQLYSFYIEIVYSLRFNTIQYIAAFEDIDLLDPYLEEIDIDIFTGI